jgi:lipoprotein-anchoring transpeptidase ErfK/SrfK
MIKRENPRIPGGRAANPMGARAMVLSGGEQAVHGINSPASSGGVVSHGCICIYNSDIMDLYGCVSVGTKAVVVP